MAPEAQRVRVKSEEERRPAVVRPVFGASEAARRPGAPRSVAAHVSRGTAWPGARWPVSSARGGGHVVAVRRSQRVPRGSSWRFGRLRVTQGLHRVVIRVETVFALSGARALW